MKKIHLASAAAASLALVLLGSVAHSQSGPQVTLKSIDGNTSVTGELVEFDGAKYRLTTVFGVIEVDALQVECEGEGCPEDLILDAAFSIHGSKTIGTELLPTLIEGYAEQLDADLVREVSPAAPDQTLRIIHEDGRELAVVRLASLGSDPAFEDLVSDAAAIGMSSRVIRENEVAAMVAAGLPDPRGSEFESVLARDALVAIVAPTNNVRQITLRELAGIVSGEITNWSAVGGADRPITLYLNDDASGNIDTLQRLVLGPFGLTISPDGRRFVNNSELSANVFADPGALGITGNTHVDGTIALGITQECGITSFPTAFAIRTEEYPLSRRLYLYHTPRKAHPHVSDLLTYVVSDEAQAKIDQAGFASRSIERAGINQFGLRLVHGMTGDQDAPIELMREMVASLGAAERLSLTFHFRQDSVQLTAESQFEARQFAQAIARGQYEGREIVLAGFSDSNGEPDVSRGLSLRRADAVLAVLRDTVGADPINDAPVVVEGYGALTPIACNTTSTGRDANRRVEVWLRPRKI